MAKPCQAVINGCFNVQCIANAYEELVTDADEYARGNTEFAELVGADEREFVFNLNDHIGWLFTQELSRTPHLEVV